MQIIILGHRVGIFIRIMLFLGIISMLKLLNINYPPNVTEMFLKSNGFPNLIYLY